MNHNLEDREDGLSHCLVCGGAEGSLPTKCPGQKMTGVMTDAIYAGNLDFDTGPMDPRPVWWVRQMYKRIDEKIIDKPIRLHEDPVPITGNLNNRNPP